MKNLKKLTKKLLKKVKKKYKVKRLRRIQDYKKNLKSILIIQSPYNSNKYLIENNSTPFFEDEEEKEEEEAFNSFTSGLINFSIGEIKDFFLFNNGSTSDSLNINREFVKI